MNKAETMYMKVARVFCIDGRYFVVFGRQLESENDCRPMSAYAVSPWLYDSALTIKCFLI